MIKYELGKVGITRHPEIYIKQDEKVFTTASEELKLWKAAEKAHKKLNQFNDYELMFIMHYIMALRGMGDYKSIMLHEFMKTKIIESRARQEMLGLRGVSAHDLALKALGLIKDQIVTEEEEK